MVSPHPLPSHPPTLLPVGDPVGGYVTTVGSRLPCTTVSPSRQQSVARSMGAMVEMDERLPREETVELLPGGEGCGTRGQGDDPQHRLSVKCGAIQDTEAPDTRCPLVYAP